MAYAMLVLSAVCFAALTWFAWIGQLGFKGLVLVLVAGVTFWLGRRGLTRDQRKVIDLPAKILFTIVGAMALLRHPISLGDGEGHVPLHTAISSYIDQVDTTTFVTFALVAMGVKFVGVITSAYGWHLLLRGQGIRFPFWQKIMTSFLIGRFIGTFMPSTIGLDGYTLYEASRYSNQTARAVTAKGLEKFIGVTGLFLGMVVTMPFGYSVIERVTEQAGRPEAAPLLAGAILLVAGGISAAVVIGLVWPVVLVRVLELLTRLVGGDPTSDKLPPGAVGKVVRLLKQFTDAVGAYHGKVGLLMTTLFAKFITHFTTAVVYYFTGLAIGVATVEFWPVVFGSTIQILATVLSPTIAGEGAREAFQAMLLSHQYGGVAQAVLAGALGFIAAEAATLWGGLFLWTRTPEWRPTFCEVDGVQVDYAWLADDDGTGFSADKVAELQGQRES
ncbi:MAG: flippase-like domain-containing protein [Alphaproteobacteria bacterium]|nr:flippase-like domain-containing protein [Alphaproteobacteria bacterium]